MKYKKLTGIILKKQNYKEADQIVTVWTREAGKIRFLAKSLRKASSKLNYAMQDLSEIEINLAGNHLPTLIGVKPLRQFSSLREDLKKTAIAFYSAELLLKMTADEHPNQAAYNLFADFLKQLDSARSVPDYFFVDSFALKLTQILGFGAPKSFDSHSDIRSFVEDIIERQLKSEPFLVYNSN